MFYGSANGGKTGVILASLLASVHRCELNEYEYLLDVINRLVDLNSQTETFELLPDRWKPKNATWVSYQCNKLRQAMQGRNP